MISHPRWWPSSGWFSSAAALLSLLVLFVGAGLVRAEEEPKKITAAEARDHVGKKVIVEMTVKASKHSVHRKTVYLDSEENHTDAKNLGITLDVAAQAKFAGAGIPQPHLHYKGKTIQVTGSPVLDGDHVYIRVAEPEQIKIVEKP